MAVLLWVLITAPAIPYDADKDVAVTLSLVEQAVCLAWLRQRGGCSPWVCRSSGEHATSCPGRAASGYLSHTVLLVRLTMSESSWSAAVLMPHMGLPVRRTRDVAVPQERQLRLSLDVRQRWHGICYGRSICQACAGGLCTGVHPRATSTGRASRAQTRRIR